jgi:hypothetical protein
MRRTVAALLAGAVLVAGCGGESKADPDRARLDAADGALTERPHDARAMEAVISAAYDGASHRQDTATGTYTAAARPYLDRAAAVWPSYVQVTRQRPVIPVASMMVQVYGNGLNRPRDAAAAARQVAETRPSAVAYLQLATWAVRAGDRRQARVATQKALELADPSERGAVRERIRRLLPQAG